MYEDTIAAIATPLGEGGIGIVRLSGRQARCIAEALFDQPLEDRRLVYGHIVDPKSSEMVDEVLIAYMVAPTSYTREDVVEINCHGGMMPLQWILSLTLRHGARLAAPGEFTLRAFLNGRIDLAQAESVLGIIQSKTEASLRLAVEGLAGRLSDRIRDIRSRLLELLAYHTARVDFPDDEIDQMPDSAKVIDEMLDSIESLIAGADAGIVYRQGVRTAIVGRPNVGKSSLLNRLLRESRAIVTPIPGTTRDTLEEVVNLSSVPFVLIDTAGIIHSADVIETLGVERSRKAIGQADLVLLVIDAGEPLGPADEEIMGLLYGKTVVVAANKSDLPLRAEFDKMLWPIVSTSALTGDGLDTLEEKMVEVALGGRVIRSDAFLVSNVRQKEALRKAGESLSQARQSLQNGMPDDFMTIDLTAALNALGEITGETITEDLLEIIFSRFCIGK